MISAARVTKALDRLDEASVIWFTTVSAVGQPMPVPVWFIRDGTVLWTRSQPDKQKLVNLEGNPQVAVNLPGDARGHAVTRLTGVARVVDDWPAEIERAYLDKYEKDIVELLDYPTPETLLEDYAVVVRIDAALDLVR